MSDTLHKLKEKIHACSALESGRMIELYQTYLAELMGGFQVYWVAGYKGKFGRERWYTKAMNGWKVMDIIFPINSDFCKVEVPKKYFKKADKIGHLSPVLNLTTSTAGKTRVVIRADAIDIEAWKNHWEAKLFAKYDICERMIGAYSLSPIAESYVWIDRRLGEAAFDETDRQNLLKALTEFPRLHYWLFLERGLVSPAQRPLSPRERSVLHHLLGPMTENEIARELALSSGTVHNYVVNIYKIYQVNSRYELIQLWLDHVPSLPKATGKVSKTTSNSTVDPSLKVNQY